MRKAKVHEIAIIDKTTGQVLSFVYKPPVGLGGRWMRIFQDTLQKLIEENPQLRGQSLRVLFYLTSIASWRNQVPAPAKLAEQLSIHVSDAYRAYAQLVEAGFVMKVDGVYSLSPLVCWKGNEQQLEEAYRNLSLSEGVYGQKPHHGILR